MKTSQRQYLCISDIHLGARRTTAVEILEHLRAYFGDFTANTPLVNLDVIFIAGDLWDDSLTFEDGLFQTFFPWWRCFLMWCARHGIKLRLLKGTPRHDREQSATLTAVTATYTDIPVDFKYIQDLAIEYIEDLDMNVLYVPDEIRHTAAIVERDVQALLDEKGLSQVDVAIMHGMFKFQLGTIPLNAKVYHEDWWLERVKYYISIGHIHTHSQYGRIIPQGSFDRLKHKEEEAKGGVWFQEGERGDWTPLFLENKLAKIYKTVRVKGTLDQALKQLDKAVRDLPRGSQVLIEAEPTHPIFDSFETLRLKYHSLVFTQKKISDDEVVERSLHTEDCYVPIILNKETIVDAVCDEIFHQHEIDAHRRTQLRKLLVELNQ